METAIDSLRRPPRKTIHGKIQPMRQTLMEGVSFAAIGAQLGKWLRIEAHQSAAWLGSAEERNPSRNLDQRPRKGQKNTTSKREKRKWSRFIAVSLLLFFFGVFFSFCLSFDRCGRRYFQWNRLGDVIFVSFFSSLSLSLSLSFPAVDLFPAFWLVDRRRRTGRRNLFHRLTLRKQFRCNAELTNRVPTDRATAELRVKVEQRAVFDYPPTQPNPTQTNPTGPALG